MDNQINTILNEVEKNIKNEQEQQYFWTHSERYRFILKKIVETRSFASLLPEIALDIGCYPYHLGQALEDLGFTVYGISGEHEPIKDNPRIKTVNIETEKFPFADGQFDLVLWTEVLEHLLRTPKIPLREIKRVLKKDGVCIITTPNVLRSINRFSLLFGKTIYPSAISFYDEKVGDASFNFRHNREYKMKELEELLVESGFKIKDKEYFVSYTPFRKRQIPDGLIIKTGKVCNFLLMKLIPSWRDTLYFEIGK